MIVYITSLLKTKVNLVFMQFTVAVQERFKTTTATVINTYCAANVEMCNQTVAVARRRYSLS